MGDAGGLIAAIQPQLDAASPGGYKVSGSAAGISLQRSPAGDLPAIGGFTDNGGAAFAQGPGAHLTLAAGDLSVQVGSGHAMDITGNFTTAEALADAIAHKVAGVNSVHIDEQTGRLKINAMQTITIAGTQAGSGGALEFAQLSNPPSGSLDVAAWRPSDGASDTVLRIDASIDTLVDRRGTFGSLLSRFDAISSSLASQGGIVQARAGAHRRCRRRRRERRTRAGPGAAAGGHRRAGAGQRAARFGARPAEILTAPRHRGDNGARPLERPLNHADAKRHDVTTVAALEALFGPVGEASIRKEVPILHPHYQAVIQASPFAVLATVGPERPRRLAARRSGRLRRTCRTSARCCCPSAAATTASTACATSSPTRASRCCS